MLCDASFFASVFVLMIKYFLIDQKGKTNKIKYAPVLFWFEKIYNNTIKVLFSIVNKVLLSFLPWTALHISFGAQHNPSQF